MVYFSKMINFLTLSIIYEQLQATSHNFSKCCLFQADIDQMYEKRM